MKKNIEKKQTKKVTLVESVMKTMERRKASVNDYFSLITSCKEMISKLREVEIERIDATIEELNKQKEMILNADNLSSES